MARKNSLLSLIPFSEYHVKLIHEGEKWYTLRSLRYHSFPFEKRKITVPDDLTDEIVKGEGYESKEELIAVLRGMKHKLPKEMWLYDLRKPST